VSGVLKAARAYREHGFTVLPLAGKAPHARLLNRTHGSKSTNRLLELGASDEQVQLWFSEPGVNIGVFCGAASGGLVVVDLDDCEFPLRGATLPLTPLVKTGRDPYRGFHLYYRSPEHIVTKPFPWGEVRSQSPAYVVAPPSLHPDTGKRYGWMLPLHELPLADYAGVLLPSDGWRDRQENGNANTGIRPTGDVLLGTPRPTGVGDKLGWLRSFDADPGAVSAMARVLGITAPLGTAFPCVLHPDCNPSAALYPTADTGEWLYHDFHAARHNAGEWLSLAQVRAALAGRVGKLSPSEHATWKLILLVEAGLLAPITVPATPLPIGTVALVQHVYERFLFLLGCRWNYDYGAPVPFSRQFAAALCDVTERDARAAIEELECLGAIYVVATQRVGGARNLRLWLPRGVEDTHLDLTREAAA
jgi:hypothetical protein